MFKTVAIGAAALVAVEANSSYSQHHYGQRDSYNHRPAPTHYNRPHNNHYHQRRPAGYKNEHEYRLTYKPVANLAAKLDSLTAYGKSIDNYTVGPDNFDPLYFEFATDAKYSRPSGHYRSHGYGNRGNHYGRRSYNNRYSSHGHGHGYGQRSSYRRGHGYGSRPSYNSHRPHYSSSSYRPSYNNSYNSSPSYSNSHY